MAIKFLCDKHRAMLSHNPAKAINAWQDSFDQGRTLYDKSQWPQALPFLGSAYETAYIIMQGKAVDKNSAYDLLTSSAVLLANTFIMLGYEGESRKVYGLTIDRLETEALSTVEERMRINQYVGHLYRNLRRLDCSIEKVGVTSSNTIQLMSATMH